MATKRTVRKPTIWTTEEWSRIATAARARGTPPLRYVREAALGHAPVPRQRQNDVILQLGSLLCCIRQLQTLALGKHPLLDPPLETTASRVESAICNPRNIKVSELNQVSVELPLLIRWADALDVSTFEPEALRLLQSVDHALGEVRP
jgi:hypothetical protein